MCGIAGVIAPSGVQPMLLAKMATSLRHRGPDDEGFLTHDFEGRFECFRGDETVSALSGSLPHWRNAPRSRYPVAMCHRRLAILDLTAAGHQPMISPDGNVALVFNGEIYNYLELADELESLGWSLRPCGDTAVLMAALGEWGPECVHRLRGMWAFAAYDRRERRLLLSRDRFGIKPVYYARVAGSLAFAPEIKGLLPALSGRPRGSVENIVRLLEWGRLDDSSVTLFDGIDALPPGFNLYVDATTLTTRLEQYYDVSTVEGEFRGSVDDAVAEYRSRMAESIRLHMRSDVRVGSCLSGGLDSNLAAAMALDELPKGRLATFTAVYDDPAVDERALVELHANRSGRFETHFVAPDPESLLAELDELVWAQDLPMASSSPFAQWAVMGLAAGQGVKVLLDGQGADEAIGGYSYFAGVYLLELVRTGGVLRVPQAARLLRDRRGIGVSRELSRAVYHQLPTRLRSGARRSARVGPRLVNPHYRSSGQVQARPTRTFRDHCIEAVQRSLPVLLRYEDRSSMAFSIESRVPFLDHPLVEFVLSLPAAYKFQDGWSKFVQRKAAQDLLPAEIVWRRDKLGFSTPQRSWKRALAGPLLELVRQADVPPFLDRERLENLVRSHGGGSTSLSEFWQTIFLLRWMQVFQVQFSDEPAV